MSENIFGHTSPDSLDFWRLSDVVLQLDGAMEDTPITDTMVGVIDGNALGYMAHQRSIALIREVGPPDTMVKLLALLQAAYMTGVVTGIKFEKAGGHRDG